MKTYLVKIKYMGTKTDMDGSLVVMAKDKASALISACLEIHGSVPEDFEEPVELKYGVVLNATKSALEGYH